MSAYGGNDQYTVFLFHCEDYIGDPPDPLDSSTGGVDSPHTITFEGNADFDSNQKKFGDYSICFDGTGDYLSLADSADWNFGTGDFTIDFWMRPHTINDDDVIFSHYESNADYMTLKSISSTRWGFSVKNDNSTIVEIWNITHGMSVDTWYHIAIVKNSGVYNFYVDGTSVRESEDTSELGDIAGPFYIGTNTQINTFDGWIDEFRISKGIARWTSNFIPPHLPYGDNTPRIIMIS